MAAKKKKFKILKTLIFPLSGIFLLSGIFAAFNIFFSGSIYPRTKIAGVSVSRLSPSEASAILTSNIQVPTQLTLTSAEKRFDIDLAELGFAYNFDASAQEAYSLTRTGNILLDFYRRAESIFKDSSLGLHFNLDGEKLNETLAVIGAEISTPPIYPKVTLVNGAVQVEKGKAGSEVDFDKTRALIYDNLSRGRASEIVLVQKSVDPSIDEATAQEAKIRAEGIKDKKLTYNFEFQTFTFEGQELLNFINPLEGYQEEKINEAIAMAAGDINRPPTDSTFIFEEGRVKEFSPSKDGIFVREEMLKEMILGNLTTLEISDESQIAFEVPVEKTPPKIKTEDVNNLGIKELIGRGSSHFAHSIANRIYNIGLASSRFKGVLIEPGQVFSFNEILGDVSALTGYKQAFVIKDGKTVLGDGGGVCQVSTTLFRAVLDAGLPIVERRAHSYRVGYYEQDSPPGIDATVFAPTTDFKFKNDTPGHLLIQPIFDGKAQTLVFEIYGTDDGRVATSTKPVTSSTIPAPEDLYVDDPTLPAGTIKQIDFRAAGAKVSFKYSVERGGEEIYSNTFFSNYRPWQAVYLRGTGPAN